MKLKHILLSSVTAAFLIGCGSSSSESSENNTIKNDCKTEQCKNQFKNRYTVLKETSLFEASYQDVINKQVKDGWRDADDSYIRSISGNSNYVVAGNRFHNSLNVIDINSKQVKYNSFQVLKDSGYGVPDTQTGASENSLTKVAVTKNNEVFATLEKHGKAGDKNKYGLYKATINSDKSIDENTAKRLAENIVAFEVSSDETNILAQDKDKNLILLDTNLNEIVSNELKSITSFALKNKDAIYVSFKKDKKNYISKLMMKDKSLELDSMSVEIPFEPKRAFIRGNNVIFASFDNHNSITNIAIFDGTKVDTFDLKLEAKTLSISPDGKLITGTNKHLSKNILIYNLNEKELQHVIPLKVEVETTSFIDNNTLAYSSTKNSVKVIKLENTKKQIDTKEILKKKVELLQKTINGGSGLDAIVTNLNLPAKENSVSYTYESNISNIDTTTGKVTKEPMDKNGTLKIIAKKGDSTYEKTLNILVRKKQQIIPITTFNTLIDLKEILTDYSPNMKGDLIAGTSLYFFSPNPESIHILKSDDNSVKEVGNKDGFKFDKGERVLKVAFIEDNLLSVSKKDKSGRNAIRISKIKNDYSLENLKEFEITEGTPLNAAVSDDAKTVKVLVKKPDSSMSVVEYSINDDIKKVNSMSIESKEYSISNDAPNPTMSLDGNNVYITEHGHGVTLKNANIEKTVEIDHCHGVKIFKDRVYVSSGNGYIYSFNKNLEDKKTYNFGLGGAEIYGFDFVTKDGKDYVLTSLSLLNPKLAANAGVSMLRINNDNSLVEEGFYAVTGQKYQTDKSMIIPAKVFTNKDGKIYILCITPQYQPKLFFIK